MKLTISKTRWKKIISNNNVTENEFEWLISAELIKSQLEILKKFEQLDMNLQNKILFKGNLIATEAEKIHEAKFGNKKKYKQFKIRYKKKQNYEDNMVKFEDFKDQIDLLVGEPTIYPKLSERIESKRELDAEAFIKNSRAQYDKALQGKISWKTQFR
jgi:hypothetical protein